MDMKQHLELLATYNNWMNTKLYEATAQLDAAEISEDRGAFFSSILGTLNHIMVGDRVWLKRFAAHPACGARLSQVAALPSPSSLSQILYSNFNELWEHRRWLDEQISAWVHGIAEPDLSYQLNYHNMKGIPASKQFGSLVLHLFNHQTHHRGQASTLLFQAGKDIGATDLVVLIPET